MTDIDNNIVHKVKSWDQILSKIAVISAKMSLLSVEGANVVSLLELEQQQQQQQQQHHQHQHHGGGGSGAREVPEVANTDDTEDHNTNININKYMFKALLPQLDYICNRVDDEIGRTLVALDRNISEIHTVFHESLQPFEDIIQREKEKEKLRMDCNNTNNNNTNNSMVHMNGSIVMPLHDISSGSRSSSSNRNSSDLDSHKTNTISATVSAIVVSSTATANGNHVDRIPPQIGAPMQGQQCVDGGAVEVGVEGVTGSTGVLLRGSDHPPSPPSYPAAVISVPLRNTRSISREERLKLLYDLVEDPVKKSMAVEEGVPHVVFLVSEETGTGKTELVREFCKRVLLVDTAAKITNTKTTKTMSDKYKWCGWISFASETVNNLCVRRLFRKICLHYPSFAEKYSINSHYTSSTAIPVSASAPLLSNTTDIAPVTDTVSLQSTISQLPDPQELWNKIVAWLQTASMPWLLVLDGLDDVDSSSFSSFIPSKCAPGASGTVLVTRRQLETAEKVDANNAHPQANTSPSASMAVSASLRVVSTLRLGVMVEREVIATAERVLGREICTAQAADLRGLAQTLHFVPLALTQCLSLLREVRTRKSSQMKSVAESLMNGGGSGGGGGTDRVLAVHEYLPGPRDYLQWMQECRSTVETAETSPLWDGDGDGDGGRSVSSPATKNAVMTVFVTALHVAGDLPGARIWAMRRCVELLVFISAVEVDLGLMDAWLRPPHTPLTLRFSNKWRIGDVSKITVASAQDAEFEMEVESVHPVETAEGVRYKWRVYRKYSEFRDCHESVRQFYCKDAASLSFPPKRLVDRTSTEESVSVRRKELAVFFEALAGCPSWGAICMTRPVAVLLGFGFLDASTAITLIEPTDVERLHKTFPFLETQTQTNNNSNIISNKLDAFRPKLESLLFLIEPLFSFGLLSTTGMLKAEPIEGHGWTTSGIKCTWSHASQAAARSWLDSIGAADNAGSDVLLFLEPLFQGAYDQYRHSPAGDSRACEQLLPHIVAAISNTGRLAGQPPCFGMYGCVYSFAMDLGGHLADAKVCAQKCLTAITERHVGVHTNEGSGDEALWHANLAHLLMKEGREDEARQLYWKAVHTFRKLLVSSTDDELAERVAGPMLCVVDVLSGLLSSSSSQGNGKGNEVSDQLVPLLEEGLAIDRRISGSDSPSIAIRLDRLSDSLQLLHSHSHGHDHHHIGSGQGHGLDVASRCLDLRREELAILKRTQGEESSAIARCLNKMGEVHLKFDRQDEAQKLFEESVAMSTRLGGRECAELVGPLYNLGMLQLARQEHGDAKATFDRVLDIHQRSGGRSTAALGNIYDCIGVLLSEQGKFREALPYMEKALEIYRQTYGTATPQVASALNNIAAVWLSLGAHDDAHRLYNESLGILRYTEGMEAQESVSRALNALGECAMGLGRYDEARASYLEALGIRIHLHGERHKDTVAVLYNLSMLAYLRKDFKEAKAMCESALDAQRLVSGPKDEMVAELLGHLADVHRGLRDYVPARALFEDCLEMTAEVFGPDHPRLAHQLTSMAAMLFSQGHYGECRSKYEEAISILKGHYGRDHVLVTDVMSQLAEVHRKLGDTDLAFAMHQECLSLRLKLLGDNHPEVASSLVHLASLLSLRGRGVDAVESCARALEIRQRVYGESHPLVAEAKLAWGQALAAVSRLDEAEGALFGALAIREEVDAACPPDSEGAGTDTALVLDAISNVFMDRVGRLEGRGIVVEQIREKLLSDAQRYSQRALLVRRAALGEEHKEVASNFIDIATILTARGRHREAYELYKIARSVRDKALGDTHPDTIDAMCSIARALRAMGKLEDARTMLEHCIKSMRRFYGEGHPYVATGMSELALLLKSLQEYEMAEMLNERALIIRRRALGDSHWLVAASKHNLGQVYLSEGKLDMANELFQFAIARRRRGENVEDMVEEGEGGGSSSKWSVELALSLDGLACTLERGKEGVVGAQAAREEAVESFRAVFGSGLAAVLLSREMVSLSKMLRARGKLNETREALEFALRVLQSGPVDSVTGDMVTVLQGLRGVLPLLGLQGRAEDLELQTSLLQVGLEEEHTVEKVALLPPVAAMENDSLLVSEKME